MSPKKLFDFFTLSENLLDWAKKKGYLAEEKKDKKTFFSLTDAGEEVFKNLGINTEKLLTSKTDDMKKEIEKRIPPTLTLHIYTDGGSRGNGMKDGGQAASAAVVCDATDAVIETHHQFLGIKTNNQAEYAALISALKAVKKYDPQKLVCISDSQLLVKQMQGEFRIKDRTLQRLSLEVKQLEKSFASVEYRHVTRENPLIKMADKLVNAALDSHNA